MNCHAFRMAAALFFAAVTTALAGDKTFDVPSEQTLAANFATPPGSARPWVYWTWLSINVTPESITADLEAMKRVGIGGALIPDVENGTPPGPMKFFDPQWQKTFQHAVTGAKRLGLDTHWPQFAGLKERLDGYLTEVAARLARPDVEIVNPGLIDTPEKAMEAGHQFRREDVDVIFLRITLRAFVHGSAGRAAREGAGDHSQSVARSRARLHQFQPDGRPHRDDG